MEGETCGRGVVLPAVGIRARPAAAELGKGLEVDDEGRGCPPSSAAPHDSLLERATDACDGGGIPGPLRGDDG